MTMEELKAAREAAVAHMWAVWAEIGGKAADETVRAAQAAPQLKSEFVTEGTYGLPRRQAEALKSERRGAQARAQARLNSALDARDELRLDSRFVAAEKASEEADSAIQKVVWASRPATTKEDEAKALNSFRWGGKDADGDWADD